MSPQKCKSNNETKIIQSIIMTAGECVFECVLNKEMIRILEEKIMKDLYKNTLYFNYIWYENL